jgi:hypothetical protein
MEEVITSTDVYYLKLILRNLDELRAMRSAETVDYITALEALEENRDWLNDFIGRFAR